MSRKSLEITSENGESERLSSSAQLGNIAIDGYTTEQELKDFAQEVFLSTHFIAYEILFLLAEGYSREQAAQKCGLDREKVAEFIEPLYRKLDIYQPKDALAVMEALAKISYPQNLENLDYKAELYGEELDGLSGAEKDVLGCVCLGMTNAQIAEQCFITVQTVKFHLSNIFRKLKVENRTEAMRVGARAGLLTWAQNTKEEYRGVPAMNFTRKALESMQAQTTP